MNDLVCVRGPFSTSSLLEWNLGVVGWGWVLAHCWALRNQTSVSSVPPLSGLAGRRVRVLVGVVFVNWIVDASICDRTTPVRSLFDEQQRMLLLIGVFVVFVECL